MKHKEYIIPIGEEAKEFDEIFIGVIRKQPELIRCKDCKHRPTIDGEYENGFDVIFPDMRCPCQCDDGWYNWMPKDDWFCNFGEKKSG